MSSQRRADSPPFRASDLNAVGKGFLAVPPRLRQGTLLAAAVCLAAGLASCLPSPGTAPEGAGAAADGKGYFFCFWNAENFFDDKENNYKTEPDKDYDEWFAADDGRVFKQKLKKLTDTIVQMNDGKGPDILALAEVESERAAEKLRDALNERLTDRKLHYKTPAYRDPHGGRHIATALLTRLGVVEKETKLVGRRERILEAHVTANGHELVVLATHWTSRVSSKEDKENTARDLYAKNIYSRFETLYKRDPKIDFLVCGDFNDQPMDDSVVKFLHATGDIDKIRADGETPMLLNLMAYRKSGILADETHQKELGTHHYRNEWMIFDQIVVSPGLLDNEGWTCDPASVRIINDLTAVKGGRRAGTPHDFGAKHDRISLDERGYSDHFPVTVRLQVAGPK